MPPDTAVEQESRDATTPEGIESNGTGSPEPPAERLVLPVDSLREAAKYLRRPFTEKAVQWKVQSAFKDKGFLAVGYIDARLVVDRLNVVCPHIWHEEIEELPSGVYLCRLTVGDTTHIDVGEGSGPTRVKAGYSDALKRAAVKFGIGVSVYKIPRAEIWVSDEEKQGYFTYKHIPASQGKKEQHVYRLTVKGERALRDRYKEWLRLSGVPTYGEAIDHGDVEDSAGALADEERSADATEPQATQSDLHDVALPLTDEKADTLRLHCRDVYATVPKSKLPKARFEAELKAASVSHDDLEAFRVRLTEMAK